MAAIRGANTKPEMIIRHGLHARGFRYRLHVKGLPGRPDIVFPARRAVILVNGCFWHGHGCDLFRWPATRVDFWRVKISGNVQRDLRDEASLAAAGWRLCVVWECALKGRSRLPEQAVVDSLAAFLEGSVPRLSVPAVPSDRLSRQARGADADSGIGALLREAPCPER